jgi:hypothetical protein
MKADRPPRLSLILCSRNDEYMGNSRWRLETTLNYIAAQIVALGAEQDVEIVVADWGSEPPLSDALALDPAAAQVVSFVTVPPDVARSLQHDSPFPEVIAINAAARRARGDFIGRIDQDTLVGRRFLETFLGWAAADSAPVRAPIDGALWFSCRRSIPYRFAVRCPGYLDVERLIRFFGRWLEVETARTFYYSGVGIWLMHRDIWDVSGGYDERMIYMNDMEIDMATRLMTRFPMLDLGKLVDYDFYHLDHYHPRGPRSSSAHRRVNNQSPREDRGIRPSGRDWGLVTFGFETGPVKWCKRAIAAPRFSMFTLPRFLWTVAWSVLRTGVDAVWYKRLPLFQQRWTRRARLAWQAVTGQPIHEWPARLRRAWEDRPSAKAES